MNDFLYSHHIDNVTNDVIGKKSNIKIGMNIYSNTTNCHDIFTEAISLLLLDNELSVRAANCLSMEYNSSKAVYELKVELEFEKIIILPIINDLENEICY